MSIKRLNHAVLFVRDAERSMAFYRDVPVRAGESTVGLYPLAWEVETLADLKPEAPAGGIARSRRRERSGYDEEPLWQGSAWNGIRNHVEVPASVLTEAALRARTTIRPNSNALVTRYGADTARWLKSR